MRIPVGEFGNRMPERAPSPQVGPDSFGGGVPQAIGELAQGAGDVARSAAQTNIANEREKAIVLHEQAQEAKVLDREAKRVEAMKTHALAQNELAAESDRIRLGIADGTIHKDEAAKLWSDVSTKIVDGHISKVDRANSELVRAGLLGEIGTHGRQIQTAVIQRNRQDIGAGLQGYLEQQERFATTDLRTAIKQAHMAIDSLGPQAGLNPEQITKAKQEFTERSTFIVADAWLTKNRNNGAGLQKFLSGLSSNQDLDPARRNALEGKAMNMLTRLENLAIAAENRRIALAGTTLQRLGSAIEAGMPIDAKTITDAVQMAKGTPYQAQAEGLIRDQRYMADLLKMTPQQQVSTVRDIREQYSKSGASPEDWASLGRIERAVQKTVEQIRTQPLAYAVNRAGAEVQPLDLMKPDSWGENLRNRTTVLLGQHRQLGGQSSLAGLMPEELGALKSVLKSATPAQQADVFAKLRQGFGDASVFRATMAQLAPDDPVTAKAGVFAALDRNSQAGKSVATEILQGQLVLRPDAKEDGKPGKGGAWPMPKDDDMAREWANYTGTAYAGRGNLRSADYQAARAIYAARAAAEGDQSGELNGRRWKAAMALVTGGIAQHNGAEVLMPYGMTYGDFKDGVAARAATFKLDPSVGRIDALPLVPIEDGKYAVRVGDSLLLDDTGREVVIDFNKPVPAPSAQTNSRRAIEARARAGIGTPGAAQ